MGDGIEQRITGHNNLQVAGDFIIYLNQTLAEIKNTEDLDQAIHWAREHLETAEKKLDKLDNLRFFFCILACCPIPIIGLAALNTSWPMAGAAMAMTLAAISPLGRLRVRIAVLMAECQASRSIFTKFMEIKISSR